MHRAGTLFLILVFLTLVGTGCTREEDRARQTAERFLNAIKSGDRPALDRTLTRRAREQTASSGNPAASGRSSDDTFTTGVAVIAGDEATVPVTYTHNDETDEIKVRLRREDGEWRVYGMSLPVMPGVSDVTMNFEDPTAIIGEGFRAAGEALGTFARGMEQGAGEFQKGFEKGYGKPFPGTGHTGDASSDSTPGMPVVPSPPPASRYED